MECCAKTLFQSTIAKMVGSPEINETERQNPVESDISPVLVMEEYQIRKLTRDDREKFLECLNEGIPSCHKDESDFNWQYVDNPAGSIRGFGAFLDEKLVAIYVVSPVRFQVGEKIVFGAQSMDTLTLPCAQKKGLFKKLAIQTYDDLIHEGSVKFTYGFPNQNSKHGFVKYLNWTLLDPCRFLVRVLNTSCVARKVKLPFRFSLPMPILPTRVSWKPKYRVKQVSKLSDGLNTLWQNFRESFNIGVIRDEVYLRWRFERRPKTDYSYFEVRTLKDELEGIGIMRIMDKVEGRVAYIMEFMSDKNNKRAMSELLHFMMKRALLEKAEMMATRIEKNHPFYHLFIKQCFFPLPKWIRPTEVYPGYVAHDTQFHSILGDQQGWHISYADDDTV